MHELGVLRHVVKTVATVAKKNSINAVKFIVLEVGDDSGYVPYYLNKLFPAALGFFNDLGSPELRIEIIEGNSLRIKEIGYL